MKLERLISMIYMLLNNEVISASALAEKYDVSQRTIYRDIDAICAAGIPVVSYQGVNGGYGIIEEYKMDKSLLGSYDVGSLITILHSLSTVFDDERAMETVRKLQSIQSEDRPPNMSMDIGGRRDYKSSLRILRNAITSQQVVQFEYINGKNERANRAVEPISLHYNNDTWYLYAYCRTRSDYREFKLSRIAHLLALPERYERNHEVTRQRSTYEWRAETESVDVLLWFSSDSLARALDFFYDGERSFNADGSLTIKLKLNDVSNAKWLLRIMMSFGDTAEILQPQELRQELKSSLEKMIKRYG
ncbi:helix-turn-helix transcriptional regulator [Cohnella cholangitidis]|uniref:YafY family transcriptional regulator n=1 Tax=Cohnella cholangitidis TaxID=2598458 RepID=A0A7G5C639_9BACL|nr:YafY family protein [Cohnella cholangitidis]QMV44673.1 YafY family transcriptional regulator [Cohnella cholangitidis]